MDAYWLVKTQKGWKVLIDGMPNIWHRIWLFIRRDIKGPFKSLDHLAAYLKRW